MSEESGISCLALCLPPAWTVLYWHQGKGKGCKAVWAALFTTISFCPFLSCFSSGETYNTSGEGPISPLSALKSPTASKISNLHSHLPSSHASLKPSTGVVLSQMLLLTHESTTDPFTTLQQSPPRLSQPSPLSEFPLRSPGFLKARSFVKIIL